MWGLNLIQWRIEETGAVPQFFLWKRSFIGWVYVAGSETKEELMKKVPAYQRIEYIYLGKKLR